MPCLYLRRVIGVLNAATAVFIAAAALGITLSICFQTLYQNGERHTTALASAAESEIRDFFLLPQHQVQMIQREVLKTPGLTSPTKHPTFTMTHAERVALKVPFGGTLVDYYANSMLTYSMSDNFTYFGAMLWFVDGTFISLANIPGFQGMVLDTRVLVDNVSGAVSKQSFAFNSATKERMSSPPPAVAQWIADYDSTPATDIRSPLVQLVWDGLTNRGGAAEPKWNLPRVMADLHASYLYLTVATEVWDATEKVAYAARLVVMSEIGNLLDSVRSTPGSKLYVVDGRGLLVGASHGRSVKTETLDYVATDPLEPECVITQHSTMASLRQMKVCQFAAASYPHDPDVVEAWDRGILESPEPRIALQVNEQFFEVVTVGGGLLLPVRVLVIVPVADVLGEVWQIVYIAVAVTIAAVLIAALLSLVLVWWLLRPLKTIATQMEEAATLAIIDDIGEGRSSMAEVAALQDAFAAMYEELQRIKSFVPQALLQAGRSDQDEEYFDEDDYTEADGSSKSVSVEARSRAQSLYPAQSISTVGDGTGARRQSNRSNGSIASRATRMTGAGVGRPRQGGQHRGVKIVEGVTRQNSSVLFVNLRNFHDAVGASVKPAQGHPVLDPAKVATMASGVLAVAADQKGVVESFHGDRFMLSFNASRPVAAHAIRAAVSGAKVVELLNRAGYALEPTAGVASGPAQVGNLGSDGMKRFTIVGPVVSQAAALERLCKLYDGVRCLVPQRLFADLKTAVAFRVVDYVQLPFAAQPALVAAVLHEQAATDEGANDEWLYQLQDHNDAAALGNAAWEALLLGDAAVAEEKLALADKEGTAAADVKRMANSDHNAAAGEAVGLSASAGAAARAAPPSAREDVGSSPAFTEKSVTLPAATGSGDKLSSTPRMEDKTSSDVEIAKAVARSSSRFSQADVPALARSMGMHRRTMSCAGSTGDLQDAAARAAAGDVACAAVARRNVLAMIARVKGDGKALPTSLGRFYEESMLTGQQRSTAP